MEDSSIRSVYVPQQKSVKIWLYNILGLKNMYREAYEQTEVQTKIKRGQPIANS